MERSTRQKQAIYTAIADAGRPLAPAEVLELAQGAVENLGIATVYRALKSLLEAGEIQAVNLPGESPRYERAQHEHHHHFQCNGCGRVFDVHACPGDFQGLAPAGFAVEAHELVLYGKCADCVGKGGRKVAGTRKQHAH